jgi:hypothetical protein
MSFPWSYSAIKTFDQCPKKYYHLKVAKDVKDSYGEAARYGNLVHEAAENRIKDGTVIPDKFNVITPFVTVLEEIQGNKFPELQLGVKKTDEGYAPCDFDDPDAWYRGIADLVIINGTTAHLIDYKTGKNSKYADMKQLDLLAGALFVLRPDLEVIKSALLYVVTKDFFPRKHTVDRRDAYLSVFKEQLDDLEMCTKMDVWNPKTSGLCGWCPVTSCEHWKQRR